MIPIKQDTDVLLHGIRLTSPWYVQYDVLYMYLTALQTNTSGVLSHEQLKSTSHTSTVHESVASLSR